MLGHGAVVNRHRRDDGEADDKDEEHCNLKRSRLVAALEDGWRQQDGLRPVDTAMRRCLRLGLGVVSQLGDELPRLLVCLMLRVPQLGDGVSGASRADVTSRQGAMGEAGQWQCVGGHGYTILNAATISSTL